MLGNALIRTVEACPPLGRWATRAYLRSGLPVPERAEWVIEQITRDLAPKQKTIETSIGSGLRLRVDPETVVGRFLFFRGSCEPSVARCLEKLLQPGMTIIDAGANVGELTARAARLVGHKGRVIALEASTETARTLKRNMEINGLANVRVIEEALSDQVGELTFHLGVENDSHSSSIYEPNDYGGRSVTVPAVNLDTLKRREGLGRVDVLKMDVEGAELAALLGGEEMLARDRPTLIFEYNQIVADRAGWTLADMFGHLRPRGYDLHVIEDRGWSPSLSGPEAVPLVGPYPKVDLLALPAQD